MPLNPLNHHYAMENPASVYDEEAMTALELAGRTTHKVNEVVKAFNQLENAVPGMVGDQIVEHINKGEFDQAISLYLGDLEKRIDNLLSSYTPGATTGDAELADMRIGPDGTKYASAGEAIRHYLNLGGLVEDTNYQTKMPDANKVTTPSAYVLHFTAGATNIPANLPHAKWQGRIATFITLPGSYYRQLFITDNSIFTRNASNPNNWSAWRSLGKPTYTIDVNGNGDFTSILKALSTYNTNARFIIKKGVYDIVREYENVYGTSYFANYVGYRDTQDVMDRGLFLGDGVELIGQGRVELLFYYDGGNNNVRNFFSVLNTSQNNLVQNVDITIEDGSCRYLIHDDFATDGGTNTFKNVTCSGHSYLSTAIGGGFGIYNTYLIEDCVFKDEQKGIAIAYHNNANDGKNKLSISGCDCEGSIYLKHYGTSVQKSLAEVFNCLASRIVLTHGDMDAYPNENITLNTWNNVTADSEYATPQMYGAIGDGKTDDTRAFELLLASGETRIFVPAGRYLITRELNFCKPNMYLHGAGIGKTFFVSGNQNPGHVCFKIEDFENNVEFDMFLDMGDFEIVGNEFSHTGLKVNGTGRSKFTNINIKNVGYGSDSVGAAVSTQLAHFENVCCAEDADAERYPYIACQVLPMSRSGGAINATNNVFVGCYFEKAQHGLVLTSADNNTFISCAIESNVVRDLTVNDKCRANVFIGCDCEDTPVSVMDSGFMTSFLSCFAFGDVYLQGAQTFVNGGMWGGTMNLEGSGTIQNVILNYDQVKRNVNFVKYDYTFENVYDNQAKKVVAINHTRAGATLTNGAWKNTTGRNVQFIIQPFDNVTEVTVQYDNDSVMMAKQPVHILPPDATISISATGDVSTSYRIL